MHIIFISSFSRSSLRPFFVQMDLLENLAHVFFSKFVVCGPAFPNTVSHVFHVVRNGPDDPWMDSHFFGVRRAEIDSMQRRDRNGPKTYIRSASSNNVLYYNTFIHTTFF